MASRICRQEHAISAMLVKLEVTGELWMYLTLDEMSYPGLRHDGDSDGVHDFLDHLRIRHACYAALRPDICWHTLQSHDRHCAGFLGNASLGAKR